MKLKVKDKGGFIGRYIITVKDDATGKVVERVEGKNLIVSGAGGYGRNIVIRNIAGDDTFPMEVTTVSLGTGTNVPADSDTDLQTPTSTGHNIVSTVVSNDQVELRFFIADVNIPNDIYREIGLFCTGRLFARSLITPNFSKSAGQSVTIQYTIILSA